MQHIPELSSARLLCFCSAERGYSQPCAYRLYLGLNPGLVVISSLGMPNRKDTVIGEKVMWSRIGDGDADHITRADCFSTMIGEVNEPAAASTSAATLSGVVLPAVVCGDKQFLGCTDKLLVFF